MPPITTRMSFKNSRPVDPESIRAILTFLHTQRSPVKAADIAKSLGLSTSSEVNPLLYWMLHNGQILQASKQPVLWTAQLYGDPSGVTNIETQSGPSFNPAEFNSEEMFSNIGDVHLKLEEPSLQDTPQSSGQFLGASHQGLTMSPSRSEASWPFGNDRSRMENTSDSESEKMQVEVKLEPDESENDMMVSCSSDENIGKRVDETSPTDKRGGVHDWTSSPDRVVIKQGISPGSCTPEVKSEPKTAFSDVDKLLQTLLGCPMKMAKSFVLVHKMKISQEEVSEIIQEARRLKYVRDQDEVYVLDKKGEEYIRGKLINCGDEEQVQIGSNRPNLNPPPKRVPSTGKPLNPFEILGRMAHPSSVGNRLPFNANTGVGIAEPRMLSLQPIRCTVNNSMSVAGSCQPMKVNQTDSLISRLMKISQSDTAQLKSSSSSSSFSLPHSSPQTSSSPFSSYQTQTQSPFTSSETSSQQSRVQQGPVPLRQPTPQGMSQGFKLPPAPLEIVRQQLKQTEISPLRDASSPIDSGLANAGMQKLLNASSQNARASPLFLGRGGNSSQEMSQLQGQQPHSLPVTGNFASPPSLSGPQSLSLDFSTESFAALNKNPVSALMEYAQSRHKVARIEVIRQSGPSHRPKFQMGVFIGNEQLSTVTCTNKKDGRKEAADMALRALIVEGKYNTEKIPTKNVVPASQMTHFDRVAALTHQHFNSLVATIADNFAGRKVIAGLVMKTSDADLGTVISIGTGNRCITGQQLSLEGNTVNDSHAEIITRRGFIRFLYKKLLTFEPNGPNGFFVKSPSGKLKIRDGITFHLYISTAPCGDGALFSPRDSASNNTPLETLKDRTHHPTFTSQVQGLLRTKMEGGEGTIPVEPDFTVQTFDGIQRGERLRTMSCTDKICRWNVVGMQGALLSHFLEPVYLDSLTLGFLFDPGHLARAVCCRVNRGDMDINTMLPQGYQLNHPWLGRVTAVEPSRETQKTKALSINWCYGDDKPEVTDGTQGLCYTSIEKALFSRCTKKNLYDSFKQVCKKFGHQELLQYKTYNQAKMAATDFQQANKLMLKKMTENSYGTWVSKPVEEEMFS
ncbi:double-stranded RNA-specific adenosine deaminase-like isoform X2 [Pecten maximus]|uniref:double-stranded RNA-specific adenosine deaminase-like isoform X2 n=1 Tax=Pecten maximus TaxID=6579 RepID=UPI001458FB4B|nr:double-stranded RNA-specific adenosine deaminase-like isoform X2 [Pecten maximus]